MSQSTTEIRIVPLPKGQDVLTDILRDGARRMLAQAVEAEVAAWIDAHEDDLRKLPDRTLSLLVPPAPTLTQSILPHDRPRFHLEAVFRSA